MNLLNLTIVQASNKLQLRLSDSVSIYSEKAYRREGGTYFEAIGNVVVSSGKDTLYGEKATFNTKSGQVLIEGSVRYIGQEITVYGSKITYNMVSNFLEIINARMITPEFSIVTSKLTKKSEKIYHAIDAEFTTCRDCTESWQISGKKVIIELDQYVQMHHALMKVKGVDVLYLPYIALPIKNKRESGLLFPSISSRNEEGIVYEQPLFWAINDSKDLTLTPTFLSDRGYGTDLEYRQIFGDKRWLEFSNKMVMDKIYYPEELNTSTSGKRYFRHIFEFENHYQLNNDVNQHMRIIGTKDLDFVRDFSHFTEDFNTSNDIGLKFSLDKRFSNFSIGFDTEYKRNLLVTDPTSFDENYVQTLPSINFSTSPNLLWQTSRNYFFKMAYGLDGDVTTFKQNRIDESSNIRNVTRFEANPYLDLNILNYGPLVLKTKYLLDYQQYKFLDEDESPFFKNSGTMSTELSFTVDRIFGLAYEEEYDVSEIAEKDLLKISNQKLNKNSNVLGPSIVGKLPKIEQSITKETITVNRSSYRHSQEFKFIHHKLLHSGETGNERFKNQIKSEDGWFDYRDAVKKDQLELDSNESRMDIPLKNTLEFQWNNVLIRKKSLNSSYLIDNRYLKDNFSYSKLGYFSVSQGILLDSESSGINDKLTRLFVDAGYSASLWSLAFSDYFNHQGGDHILSFSGQKRFERLSLLTQYNYNSYSSQRLIKSGFQFRPIDIFGFSALKEYNIETDESTSSIYQVDFMPHNNCWIFNLNYKENFIEQRYAFNFVFNYGNDEFKNYRNEYFSFGRLE